MKPQEVYTIHATWDGEVYIEDHLGKCWEVDRIEVFPAMIYVKNEEKIVLQFERGDDDSQLYAEGKRHG
jgi:hypothetical protein